jgi:hypothetical protein
MLAVSAPNELQALLPSHKRPQRRGSTEPVQLSARVPAELRDAAHAAAGRLGISVTELIERALWAEVERATNPAAQFAADIAASIQQRIAAALADGTWDEAVAAYTATDPDLAS